MGGKSKKKKNSISNGGGADKKKAKKPAAKGGKRSGKSKNRCNVDIFTEAAMDNAYYVCHNVQDLLKIRGFPWPDAQKKKKKGKKK